MTRSERGSELPIGFVTVPIHKPPFFSKRAFIFKGRPFIAASSTQSPEISVGALVAGGVGIVLLDGGVSGVGHELREAAGRHEGVERRILAEDVFHLLHRQR